MASTVFMGLSNGTVVEEGGGGGALGGGVSSLFCFLTLSGLWILVGFF